MTRMIRLLTVMFWLTCCTCPGAAAEKQILFLGDSLTAGLGVTTEQAYPAVVAGMLADRGVTGIRIINAGISGSTTASGVSRLKWYLRATPHVLLLALGANDGLRGLSLEKMAENLDRTVSLALENGIRVILAGMEIPPNYGPEYTAGFRNVYRDLAEKHGVKLIPFLLDGVGGVASLNQADGLHPNPEGHQRIAETVLPYILEAL